MQWSNVWQADHHERQWIYWEVESSVFKTLHMDQILLEEEFRDFKWYLLQPCLSWRWWPIWLIHNLHTLPLITTTHCHRHLIVQNDQSAFVVSAPIQPVDTWCNHSTPPHQECHKFTVWYWIILIARSVPVDTRSQPNQDVCLWL